MELTEKMRTIKLLDVYGNMLTAKQKETLEGYLLYDITLTELANMQNTSRQAIFDVIQKTLKALAEFEEKLGFLKKCESIEKVLEGIDCKEETVQCALKQIKDLIN